MKCLPIATAVVGPEKVSLYHGPSVLGTEHLLAAR